MIKVNSKIIYNFIKAIVINLRDIVSERDLLINVKNDAIETLKKENTMSAQVLITHIQYFKSIKRIEKYLNYEPIETETVIIQRKKIIRKWRACGRVN